MTCKFLCFFNFWNDIQYLLTAKDSLIYLVVLFKNTNSCRIARILDQNDGSTPSLKLKFCYELRHKDHEKDTATDPRTHKKRYHQGFVFFSWFLCSKIAQTGSHVNCILRKGVISHMTIASSATCSTKEYSSKSK